MPRHLRPGGVAAPLARAVNKIRDHRSRVDRLCNRQELRDNSIFADKNISGIDPFAGLGGASGHSHVAEIAPEIIGPFVTAQPPCSRGYDLVARAAKYGSTRTFGFDFSHLVELKSFVADEPTNKMIPFK